MNYTINQLIDICKKYNVKGYSKKRKEDIVALLASNNVFETIDTDASPEVNVVEDTKENDKATKLRVVDLFAGTGAFSLAFTNTGKAVPVYANDFCDASNIVYKNNVDDIHTTYDLNTVDVDTIPDHDILTGGFPCQPFSIAGRQKGFDDNRSNVFWKILDIIDAKKPLCVLLENVKNIVSHDEGKTFNTITTLLEERGYKCSWKVVDASDVSGIPQHRERIYIVCMRDGRTFDFDIDNDEQKDISLFLQHPDEVNDKYYYNDKCKIWDKLVNDVTKDNVVYQYRRYYVRENKSGECPTLTANMGTGGHNVPIIKDSKGIRKLTPRECFNLQGFPSSYCLNGLSDSKLYTLAGNAVSLPVVSKLASKIVDMFPSAPKIQ